MKSKTYTIKGDTTIVGTAYKGGELTVETFATNDRFDWDLTAADGTRIRLNMTHKELSTFMANNPTYRNARRVR